MSPRRTGRPPMTDSPFGLELADRLDREGPGSALWTRLRAAYLSGALSVDSNRVNEPVGIPPTEALRSWPPSATELSTHQERGASAIRNSQVALLVLNGGMATRFGGVVKGTVEVADGVSFLGLKLRDALRVSTSVGGQPPRIFLMNSEATDAGTREHLEANDYFGYPRARIHSFKQLWAARLTPEGAVFLDDDGQASMYGPGHGDVGPCLVASGLLGRFVEEGGHTLLLSNVDNVVATLCPALLGAHLSAGSEITVEVVEKWAGDAGGAPALLNGRVQIMESFRFPEDFDQASIPVFNTNTFWLSSRALSAEAPLSWFVVHKKVDGRPAVQFERLVGELTSTFESTFVVVPRAGLAARFIPVKCQEDLDTERDLLMAAWRSRLPGP